MYQVGEKIIYGSNGVCTVLDVTVPPFVGKDERDRLYYKLQPKDSTEVIYVPVDTTVFMRPIMSREEAEAVVARMPDITEAVCSCHSITMLRQQYDSMFRNHNCEAYVALAKGIYLKGQNGKKLGQTDQRYMKRAEDMLYGELAAALEIPAAEVPEYIRRVLEK